MAPRSLQLRTRSSTGNYPPSELGSPPFPSPLTRPDPYGREPVNPPGYEPGGSGPAPYDPLSSIRAPANPASTYEPGGGVMPPYDPLSSVRVSPTYAPAIPPPRPSGLGGLLAGAVVAPNASTPSVGGGGGGRGAPGPQVQAQAPSPFVGVDRQNSGPNDRFRGGGTALDLSGLLGGLFGGGGGQRAPAPAAAAPAVAGGARGGQAGPDMTGITFDENGNPTYNGLDASVLSAPGLQQDPNLASTVGRANWWKSLR